MAREDILVGLEIGTSKVCVVVAEAGDDGTLQVQGIGLAQSYGVRKGEIIDFDNAQSCVREALCAAEESSGVEIGSAYVAITGNHISSFNCRGQTRVPDDQEEITEADCDRVSQSARAVGLPPDHDFLHTILQHYYVDGQEGVLNPVGMAGAKLEADFHHICGLHNRIANTIRCVKEVVEVADIVFAGIGSAQAVLNTHDKELGALVIDMGGGTTDYLAYVNGAVRASGVLAIGGDHITNDLSLGLHLPMTRAEKLKCEEGAAIIGQHRFGETIFLKDDVGFAGKEIEREMLNTIIHLRVQETLEKVRQRLEEENVLDFLGAGIFLTGGCSLIKGMKPLAEQVFRGIPVRLAAAQDVGGIRDAVENPQLATAIGLVRYAQAAQQGLGRGGLLKHLQNLLRRFRLF